MARDEQLARAMKLAESELMECAEQVAKEYMCGMRTGVSGKRRPMTKKAGANAHHMHHSIGHNVCYLMSEIERSVKRHVRAFVSLGKDRDECFIPAGWPRDPIDNTDHLSPLNIKGVTRMRLDHLVCAMVDHHPGSGSGDCWSKVAGILGIPENLGESQKMRCMVAKGSIDLESAYLPGLKARFTSYPEYTRRVIESWREAGVDIVRGRRIEGDDSLESYGGIGYAIGQIDLSDSYWTMVQEHIRFSTATMPKAAKGDHRARADRRLINLLLKWTAEAIIAAIDHSG